MYRWRRHTILRFLALLTMATVAACAERLEEKPAALPTASPSSSDLETPLLTPAQVRAKQAAGEELLFLDVRSESAFRARHIEGARNIPWRNLGEDHRQLPKDRLLILYCT